MRVAGVVSRGVLADEALERGGGIGEFPRPHQFVSGLVGLLFLRARRAARSGRYAHYWLGELYLLDGDSASAKKHFETLLGQFGDNRRVPDAMFKLGRIYHQEGDVAKAKDILDRVVNEYAGSDSTAPRLAREYLQQNF